MCVEYVAEVSKALLTPLTEQFEPAKEKFRKYLDISKRMVDN